MKKSALITIVIILVLAIVAAYAGYTYLTTQKVEIYLFKDNYEAGTKLSTSMFTVIQTDVNIVKSLNNSDVRYIVGDKIFELIESGEYLKTNVYAGMPLMSSNTVSYGGNPIEMRLSPDMVAYTVGVNNITGITPNLSYDSRVNISVSYVDEQNQPMTKILLENVRVLDVQSMPGGDGNPSSISAITLELSREDQLKVQFAKAYAQIDFSMVKNGQYTHEIPAVPYTDKDIRTITIEEYYPDSK